MIFMIAINEIGKKTCIKTWNPGWEIITPHIVISRPIDQGSCRNVQISQSQKVENALVRSPDVNRMDKMKRVLYCRWQTLGVNDVLN